MTQPRLVLVTRRFWPLVGGAEMVMANLATEFHRRGLPVRIVTAQWESHWPIELVHREVPVVRLPNPRQRGWGTFRYMRALARWLRTQRNEYDLVYVSMLKHDAYAALGALSESCIPVVLRAEGAGETGDCRWHQLARFGSRIKRRCLRADALVAPSEAIEREFHDAGFDARRIVRIPNGVRVPPPRDPARKLAARAALAEVNHDLRVAEEAPVVVYTGRLQEAKGLFELIRAWPIVARRWPQARLWIVGEGPAREELYETILELELRGRVLLPGAFDEVWDLLEAADLFVLPSYEEGMSLSLLEAMAAGVPVIASDIPANRKLIAHEEQGLLVPVRSVDPLAAAILRQLDQKILAAHYADAARRRVQEQYSLEAMAERHHELFETLIEAKRRTPS